jgi:signal transduction histidine kinase
VLSVPLVIIARRDIVDREKVELQAEAARTLTEITTPLDRAQLRAIANEADAPRPFQVYRPDGALLFGTGPARADEAVRAALLGRTTSHASGGSIVVITPIIHPGSEDILGALRVPESLDGADGRATAAFILIVGAGGAGILAAWLVARRLARRLSAPVVALAQGASRLGRAELLDGHDPVGIAEVDLLGEALVSSSRQVHEAFARERQFSSDVSHQLRTPLTGLRLKLEAALERGDVSEVDGALGDLRRLEHTVEHILQYSRDLIPTTSTTDLSDAIERGRGRWSERGAALGRAISVRPSPGLVVRSTPASVDQVLDVLIDNALRHGRGAVEIEGRPIPGGAVLDVRDEGSSADRGTDEPIFARGHGIGLAFARALAEAEGGRLVRTSSQPTMFRLVLLAAAEDDEGPPVRVAAERGPG